MELCVVLVKEKRKRGAPTSSISCESTGGTETERSLVRSNSSGRKRDRLIPFKFPVKKLVIVLFAPIETFHRKNTVTTGVHQGKTNKELTFDLSP